jgi:predicted transporter
MKPFEYVMVLFSILLGVCITQMATNIVLVIQNFKTSVLYAPPILWNAAALLAILAHWVHFYKAEKRETWNALQLSIVFITPLIYFIPATLLAQAPRIDDRLNYEVLFETNKSLIYITVLLFVSFTMAQNYVIYNNKKIFVYTYYSIAIVVVLVVWASNSKILDHLLAVGIFVSESLHHYVINPIRLSYVQDDSR